LSDLDAAEYGAARSGTWARGLLIRRKIANGELAFFSTGCPAGTSIEQLVLVERQRWVIEDGFDTAENELGLDYNETRSWHGWHRHVSLRDAGVRHDGQHPAPCEQPDAEKKAYPRDAFHRAQWSVRPPKEISPKEAVLF
jgi:SRSO17 transposase